MNDLVKERLLVQFRDHLNRFDDIECPPDPSESAEQFSLFAELSALKTTTKQQSRQVHEALQGFKEVFQTLRTSHDLLVKELERRKEQETEQRRTLLKPLLEQLLDLYDRLHAGSQAGAPAPRRLFRRQNHILQAMRDGQAMTLARLGDILAAYQVRPMQCVGQPLDPHTMHVLETEHRSDSADGVVTAELRSGFYWADAILRPAQVKVNKLQRK